MTSSVATARGMESLKNTEEQDVIRGVVATIVGLGLVGGVGAATYNDDGTTTVTIDEHNTPDDARDDARVTFKTEGKAYSCPEGVEEKLEPGDIEAGRIQITLRRTRKQLRAIEKSHPGDTLPPAVYDGYHKLSERYDALVDRFNDQVDRHNAILEADCTE